MSTLEKVINKETNEVYYLVPNRPKRFIDGDEFVCVKRNPNIALEFYIRRKPLITNAK